MIQELPDEIGQLTALKQISVSGENTYRWIASDDDDSTMKNLSISQEIAFALSQPPSAS